MRTVTLWRYVVPNEKHSGWAIFVLGSDGYFSSVSDFGNYAFLWRAHGKNDFREFFLDVAQHPDYFIGKLANGEKEYDGHGTLKSVAAALLEAQEEGSITESAVKEELELLSPTDSEVSEAAFEKWRESTEVFDGRDCAYLKEYRYPWMVQRFVTEAMVRLVPLLKKDLEACSTSSTSGPAAE